MSDRDDILTRVKHVNPVPPDRAMPLIDESRPPLALIERGPEMKKIMRGRGAGSSPPPPPWRRPRWVTVLAATAIVMLAIGVPLALMRNGDDSGPIAASTTSPTVDTTTEPPTTTTAPTTTAPAPTTTVPAPTTTVPPMPGRLGFQWSQAPSQAAFGFDDFISAVVPGGPGLIAVGGVADEQGFTDAAVWASADGSNWTRVGDPAVFVGVPTAFGTDMNQVLIDVTDGFAGIVAVGWADTGTGDEAPPIWTSSDGIAWQRSEPAAFPDGEVWLTGVATGADRYVTVGSDGIIGDAAIWTSEDAETWQRVDTDFGAGFGESSFESITWTGTRFLAVGSGGDSGFYFGGSPRPLGMAFAWTSVDGIDWTPTDLASGPSGAVDIASSGDAVIVVGTDSSGAVAWISTDGGLTFDETRISDSRQLFVWSALTDGDRLLVVGQESSPFPTFAVTWAAESSAGNWYETARIAGSADEGDLGGTIDQRPGGFRDVIQFEDGFLAVGGTGNGSAPVWIGDWKE